MAKRESLYKYRGKDIDNLKLVTKATIKLDQSLQREKQILSKRFQVENLREAAGVILSEEILEEAKKAIKLLKEGKKAEALQILHRCFILNPSTADDFVRHGNLQYLESCFLSSDCEVLHRAAYCAINLIVVTPPTFQKVLQLSSVLIQFLQGSDTLMQELCAWALGNMAGSSHECRQILLSQGCMLSLFNLISSKPCLTLVSRTQCVLFALCNLAKDECFDFIRCMQEHSFFSHIILTLKETSVDSGILFVLGWLVYNVYSRQETFAEYQDQFKLILHHVITKLIDITSLQDKSLENKVIFPYLFCTGNIIGHSLDMAVSACDHPRFLPALISCLSWNSPLMINSALWLLTNCIAEPSCRVFALFQPQFLPILLDLCQSRNIGHATNALYIVQAMTNLSYEINTYLVHHGILSTLAKLLRHPQSQVVTGVISAISIILTDATEGQEEFLALGGPCLIQNAFDLGTVTGTAKQTANCILDVYKPKLF